MPSPNRKAGRRWLGICATVKAEESDCWLCGAYVPRDVKYPHPLYPSVDHVIPLAKGGEEYDRGNCRLAHLSCNSRRKDSMTAGGRRVDKHMRDWG